MKNSRLQINKIFYQLSLLWYFCYFFVTQEMLKNIDIYVFFILKEIINLFFKLLGEWYKKEEYKRYGKIIR